MIINPELLSPCGLYCGVCGIRIAWKQGNQALKEKLAKAYGLKPEEIKCEGCLAAPEKVFVYCKICPIKTCVKQKKHESCAQCPDFPCEHINQFPYPEAKKVILKAIPRWRELGTEKWVAEEEKRYLCPACGKAVFRGAHRCPGCKTQLAIDI